MHKYRKKLVLNNNYFFKILIIMDTALYNLNIYILQINMVYCNSAASCMCIY